MNAVGTRMHGLCTCVQHGGRREIGACAVLYAHASMRCLGYHTERHWRRYTHAQEAEQAWRACRIRHGAPSSPTPRPQTAARRMRRPRAGSRQRHARLSPMSRRRWVWHASATELHHRRQASSLARFCSSLAPSEGTCSSTRTSVNPYYYRAPWRGHFSAGHSRAPTLNTGTRTAAIERSHYEPVPSTPPLLIRGLPE